MKIYSEFHDGGFKGFLIEGDSVSVFLSTERDEGFVIVAQEVAAMAADGFKAGNVVFEVLVKTSDEITQHDVSETYGPLSEATADAQARELLAKSRLRALQLLEINPSYGGQCLLLARSIDVVPRAQWEMVHLRRITSPSQSKVSSD